MIPTIPVALTAAPATAAIATTGLGPLLWVIVGLMVAAVVLIVHEAWLEADAARGLSIVEAEPRARLRVVAAPHDPALDAA
jgi:hypothetical protein